MSRKASPKAWWEYVKALPCGARPSSRSGSISAFTGASSISPRAASSSPSSSRAGSSAFPSSATSWPAASSPSASTVIVVFKGRDFISVPKPASLSLALLDPRKMGITAARVKLAAFWLFVLTGFLLTLTALLPMLPLLRTAGQKFMFEFHRYSALALAPSPPWSSPAWSFSKGSLLAGDVEIPRPSLLPES